ncbi:MAG: efflux RND transporter periplasmic adaptor subunit, partial [Acidobacteria bacterium]
ALLPACAFLFAGCSREAPPPLPPPAEVSVLKIEPRDTPVTFEYIAQTQSPQEVDIVARVSGFLDKQLYTEGAIVKEGQVLFKMDQKPFIAQLDSAQAAWNKAKAANDTAMANLKRVKPLAELNALSQKDLDDATGNADTTAASVAQAQANVDTARLNLSYTTIASPLRGIAAAAQQKEGAYLSPQNNLLTTVSSLNPMWVNFSVSENEFKNYRDQVAKGLIVPPKGGNYVAELIQVDDSTFPLTGRITFVDPSFNPQTGTFLIRVSVPNPGGTLRPNQYVRVRLKGATRPNAITIPQRAVQQGAKGHFVWVVNQSDKAELRPIVVGEWYRDSWFISQGLAAGDRVAVDGTLRLAPDAPVKMKPYVPKPDSLEAAPATRAPGATVSIHFAAGKAALDAEAMRLLKELVPAMKAGTNPIDVTGFADRTGNRSANVELAKRRALAVRDALLAEGLPADRVRLQTPREVTGAGSDRDARRVEIAAGK